MSAGGMVLGDWITLRSGGTPSKAQAEFWNGSIPWVSFKDLSGGKLRLVEDYITELAVANGAKTIPPGTLLMPVRGMGLAKHFPVSITTELSAFNQDLKAIVLKSGLTASYLYYWLNANSGRILGLADEAAHGTKRIQTDRLLSLSIEVPSEVRQAAIVTVLSAYDDLIDNNTRRIAILEEMARRIFEEWFVHFRAPGCEGLPFVDSAIGPVPQGWELVPLERLCSRITDGAHHSPPSVEHGRPMLSVKDMRTWGFEFTESRSISQVDFDDLVRNNCRPLAGDILIAKDGANLNKHTFLIEDDMNAVILSSIAILRPVPSIEEEFFLATLKSEDVSRRIKSSRSGAAIPRIILKDFRRLPLLLPPVGLRKRFETIAEPIHKLCRVLSRSNTNLRAQRDMLLPKLILGEIDISSAPTSVKEAAE